MIEKKGITKTILETMAVATMVLILSTGLAGAYSNPLNMLFKSQIPPGDSYSQNCGQASILMAISFYDGTTPTEQGIKDIDTWH